MSDKSTKTPEKAPLPPPSPTTIFIPSFTSCVSSPKARSPLSPTEAAQIVADSGLDGLDIAAHGALLGGIEEVERQEAAAAERTKSFDKRWDKELAKSNKALQELSSVSHTVEKLRRQHLTMRAMLRDIGSHCDRTIAKERHLRRSAEAKVQWLESKLPTAEQPKRSIKPRSRKKQ